MILSRYISFFQKFTLRVVSISLALAYISSAVLAGEYRLKPHAVVELFTSQGCASCPLADKILAKLAQDENFIALSYHVDYWDYNGWKDSFATSANSKLQIAYSKTQAIPRIYTPQMIINGTKDVIGSHSEKVKQALKTAKLPLSIDMKSDAHYLTISIDGNEDYPESTLWLVTFISKQQVQIKRGENRGKTLSYTNIVTQRRAIGMWHPDTGAKIKLPIDEILNSNNDGLAILVQNNFNGLPSSIIAGAAYIN